MPERTTQILDLATRDFYAVPLAGTVEQAVEILRAAPDKAVFYCYALDEAGRLAGVVPVRKLLTAAPGTRVSEIASSNVIALPADGERALLEDFFATYRFLAFPVVDAERRILGVVQADAFSDQLMARLCAVTPFRGAGAHVNRPAPRLLFRAFSEPASR